MAYYQHLSSAKKKKCREHFSFCLVAIDSFLFAGLPEGVFVYLSPNSTDSIMGKGYLDS